MTVPYGEVAIYTHQNMLVVKTDIMKDIVVAFPTQVADNGEVVNDQDYETNIVASTLKGATEKKTVSVPHYLDQPNFEHMDITCIPMKLPNNKAMGPDLIPDKLFSGKEPNTNRDMIISSFLLNPIESSICESRLMTINKSSNPIPDLGDLRPIVIEHHSEDIGIEYHGPTKVQNGRYVTEPIRLQTQIRNWTSYKKPISRDK